MKTGLKQKTPTPTDARLIDQISLSLVGGTRSRTAAGRPPSRAPKQIADHLAGDEKGLRPVPPNAPPAPSRPAREGRGSSTARLPAGADGCRRRRQQHRQYLRLGRGPDGGGMPIGVDRAARSRDRSHSPGPPPCGDPETFLSARRKSINTSVSSDLSLRVSFSVSPSRCLAARSCGCETHRACRGSRLQVGLVPGQFALDQLHQGRPFRMGHPAGSRSCGTSDTGGREYAISDLLGVDLPIRRNGLSQRFPSRDHRASVCHLIRTELLGDVERLSAASWPALHRLGPVLRPGRFRPSPGRGFLVVDELGRRWTRSGH